MVKSCSNCNAFAQINNQGGVCRAKPPIPMIVGATKNRITGQMEPLIQAIYPNLTHDSWCREHQPMTAALSDIDLSSLAGMAVDGSA